ncbi:MAG: thioesterase family protein [Anaerolineales bacterium]|jgi:predicted thioesterase
MPSIKVGMTLDAEQVVTSERTAPHIGSGSLRVYATPAMGMLIEETCCALIDPLLPDGKTTVGTEIQLRHLAPTPAGGRVTIRVEVVAIDGNSIVFDAQLRDEFEPIGTARHRRAIVDIERFMKRVQSKSTAMDDV